MKPKTHQFLLEELEQFNIYSDSDSDPNFKMIQYLYLVELSGNERKFDLSSGMEYLEHVILLGVKI